MKFAITLILLIGTVYGFSQSEPNNGVADSEAEYYALKNAQIYVSPGKKIKGTILIKGDRIEKVGPFVSVPNGAVEIDLSGKVILPAFVELYSAIGIPKAKASNATLPQMKTSKDGAFYWNESIHPEVDANELYVANEKENAALIEKGFGFALTHQNDGIARGTGAFVSLNGENPILKGNTTNSFFSFSKGVSKQSYPSSQMGSIALLRQTFYDADWYAVNSNEKNVSLDALKEQRKGNAFFASREKWELMRAQKIATEFDFNFIYLGSGNEYQIVDEIAQTKSTVVVPMNFPKAYDVKNPYISRQIPLSDLKHWEMAPANAFVLASNGTPICLSSFGSKKSKEFWANVRRAIQFGLTEEQALEALTTTPAKIAGFEALVGTLEPGKIASLIVYDKNPLKEEAKIVQTWLKGECNVFITPPKHKIKGVYNIQVDGYKFPLEIKDKQEGSNTFDGEVTYTTTNKKGETEEKNAKAFIELKDSDITIQFIIHNDDLDGNVSLQGKVTSKLGVFEGDGLLPNGKWVKWSAIKSVKSIQFKKKEKEENPLMDTTIRISYPHMAYGFDELPEQETIVIRNATIWTNEADGILENGTVVIKDGKITYAGNGKPSFPPRARLIDAEGKHVTCGIIDEHSHIAISRGVNESGQAISAEVSIADVVDPDDIDIYRQLSGGVTSAQLLHGSANPIGGQSALIKLKWGHSPDQMLIDDAPKFIKFALGENVKQSNWGDHNTVRFPQTRMGVEQIFFDGFMRAREYRASWLAFEKDQNLPKPRYDLELETLNEILDSERFVTCHSYVQSEINMLMHVADSMGFTLNTFTHILEGYKLADKMVKHGAGGSTFSDWWAYKYEVKDAIPHNAALMHEQGVVVAINSDDAEMGRRLNQEAAKGVKYGGMSEEDAWKMVTLNPAKLLHLDDRMGSLKAGKDADVVVWTDNPLSIHAKVEYTIVDGTVLYDAERDAEMRQKNQQEKARIISKMLDDNNKGGEKKSFFKKENGHYHCNTLGEDATNEENHH